MSTNATRSASLTSHAALIDWKTHAWTDPGMVSWYSQRMVENSGTNQLKHLLEIDLIRRNVSGQQVVDVGTGTGRAAIALASDGCQVTGVDSSQAMLDETRRLAGALSLDLRQGDLLALPCADGSADTVVALNVLVHFPNWRDALSEWLRVVRPGGRILFDIHSLANVESAFGLDSKSWPEPLRRSSDPQDFLHFNMRVGTQELLDYANAQGLKVHGIYPYGAFLSAGNTNWKLWERLELQHKWKRMQSWIAKDPALFKLNLFIEQALIEYLAPSVAGRLFVVMEKSADAQANSELAHRLQGIESALRVQDGVELMTQLPLDRDAYHAAWEALLPSLRCQHYLYRLVAACTAQWPGLPWKALLPDWVQERFAEWHAAESLDRDALTIVRQWAEGMQVPSGNLDAIASGAQYKIMERLLQNHYGCFTGVRT